MTELHGASGDTVRIDVYPARSRHSEPVVQIRTALANGGGGVLTLTGRETEQVFKSALSDLRKVRKAAPAAKE